MPSPRRARSAQPSRPPAGAGVCGPSRRDRAPVGPAAAPRSAQPPRPPGRSALSKSPETPTIGRAGRGERALREKIRTRLRTFSDDTRSSGDGARGGPELRLTDRQAREEQETAGCTCGRHRSPGTTVPTDRSAHAGRSGPPPGFAVTVAMGIAPHCTCVDERSGPLFRISSNRFRFRSLTPSLVHGPRFPRPSGAIARRAGRASPDRDEPAAVSHEGQVP